MREKISHVHQWLRQKGILALVVLAIATLATPAIAARHAAAVAGTSGNDFNIQLSPSPLVVNLTPGKVQTASLNVRNFSNHQETLYPRLTGFTVDKHGKNIKLSETPPINMVSWVSFNEDVVTLPAGSTKQVTVAFNTPRDVGFSYSAAITLSRSQSNPIESDGVHLRGAVAVFCLININRPDAKSTLTVSGLAASKSQYQFLPADFTLTIANKGNVISQPTGSLFIQRSYDSATPIATIPINAGSSYILPGTERNFSVSWDKGFPAYVKDADGKRHLSWDWKHLSELRFGRYVAKAVVVYNNGHSDVPVITSTAFWVIPWTLIIGLLLTIFILAMGVIGWGRLIFKGTRKVKSYAARRK